MFKTIQIGGQTVDLLSNAATPIYYHQLFKKDVVKNLAEAAQDNIIAVNMAPELAYIMKNQAAKTDMSTLNIDTYIEWLETFGALDFVDANEAIWEVYYGNIQTSSESKKKRTGKANEK